MPEGRHSTVSLGGEELHIRLARRKHRPRGSLMVRQCCCGRNPYTGVKDAKYTPVVVICPVCLWKQQLENRAYRPGELLFQFPSAQFLAGFKQRSAFEHACTLRTKSWRAGHATVMADWNVGLGALLA